MMDIRIAERYFERCVARLGNELALVSFINACRLAVPGAFSAMAKIMNAQMVCLLNSIHRYIIGVNLKYELRTQQF